MKVKNKQTGVEYEWPREQWDRLSRNIKTLYTVLDEKDAPKAEKQPAQKISNTTPTKKDNRPDTGEATGNGQNKKTNSSRKK